MTYRSKLTIRRTLWWAALVIGFPATLLAMLIMFVVEGDALALFRALYPQEVK